MMMQLRQTVLLATEFDPDTERWVGLGVVTLLVAIALAVLALVVAAVVSILRSDAYTSAGKCLWVLMIIALPVLGSLGWFFWGRHGSAPALEKRELVADDPRR